MSFSTAIPSPTLAPFVKQYWGIENCISAGNEYLQRIVPSGLIELSFYLGDRPKALDSKRNILENTVVTGQLKGYYELEITGSLSLFSISFQPQGAMMFFGIPLSEFYNQNVSLKDLLKAQISDLESKLYEAGSFNQKVVLTEEFLSSQLKENYKKFEQARINNSIDLINQSRGIIDIDKLASESFLSRKQFERTFSEFIGSSPKQFLKTIRFQNAIHIMEKNNKVSLADLAYHCGYYDQSHMNNDFQSLAGMTPKQYFAECEPYSDYFQ